jgi:hypothetical protein
MTSKLMASLIMLIVFSVIVGLAVVSSGLGIILQTVVFAQTLEADDDATITSRQDSSSDGNVLDNENDFGVDGTAIGQNNEADEASQYKNMALQLDPTIVEDGLINAPGVFDKLPIPL